MIIWNSLKLLPHIHGYLFIFANTEIYVIKYKTHLKIVETTFDKFFRAMYSLLRVSLKHEPSSNIKRLWPIHTVQTSNMQYIFSVCGVDGLHISMEIKKIIDKKASF